MYFPSIAILTLNSQKTGKPNRNLSMYFNVIIFLTMFIFVSYYLKAYSKAKTGNTITMLKKLKLTKTLLMRSNPNSEDSQLSLPITNVAKININFFKVGNMVQVFCDAFPLADGTIVLSNSTFDKSSLAKKSCSIIKNTSNQIFTKIINTNKLISVKVIAISGALMFNQIVKMIRESQTK